MTIECILCGNRRFNLIGISEDEYLIQCKNCQEEMWVTKTKYNPYKLEYGIHKHECKTCNYKYNNTHLKPCLNCIHNPFHSDEDNYEYFPL